MSSLSLTAQLTTYTVKPFIFQLYLVSCVL